MQKPPYIELETIAELPQNDTSLFSLTIFPLTSISLGLAAHNHHKDDIPPERGGGAP